MAEQTSMKNIGNEIYETMNYNSMIDNAFQGCCMITQNDKTLLHHVSGYSDWANKIPNTPDTKFATASAGKVFVAVAILQLIENDTLRLEDTIGCLLHLDESDIDPDITVEQLLTHTSGVPDYFDESMMEEYEELWRDYPNYKIRSNSDLLPLFIHKPMMYPKGERFQYNNSGYVLLAMIIEKITAMPFDKYLQLHLFDVCGMKDTGYYELDRLPANCANNYIFDGQRNEYRTNIYSVDVKGTGAGGAFTTVSDISCFWKHLLDYRLLSEKMTDSMLCCHSGNEKEGYYGYGIWLRQNENNSYSPYFEGCDPGVSFISLHDVNKSMTITLVSNYCDNVWKIMRKIRETLLP